MTPHELGKQTAIVTITYEDSDGKQQQIEKKVELEALEPSDEYAMGDNMMGIQGEGMDYGAQGDVENSQNPGVWGWAAAAIGIIAIVPVSYTHLVKAAIEERGGRVTGSVTSKTNYLINNDTASGSSKNKKAKELGVPIISEDKFIEMLG